MKKKQREILVEVCYICNQLGSVLDGTSTSTQKYIDRQKAHMDVHRVLYAVLTDHPDNEHSADDYSNAYLALERLRGLKNKIYPDKNGNY